MAKVESLNKEPNFSRENELSNRITDLISEYNGELSLVSVIGILQLKVMDLRENQQ